MILAITGHRPSRLGGYGPSETQNEIRKLLTIAFVKLQPKKIVVGMALGVDQWSAEIASECAIPFIAAIPFKGQESAWPESSQAHYRHLLTLAAEQHTVSEGDYSPWKMHKRNEWMVEQADVVLAVWDGTSGGTASCVKYAESLNKFIIRINPKEL